MFDPKTVSLGIAPIGWCNDDMPELGAENTFQQTVSEMALAGFTGCEIGNKYPTDPAELKKALDLRGMRIASRWYSSFILTRSMEEEEKDFIANLDFLEAVGANHINVSEQSYSIQGKVDVPILTGGHKHVMNDEEWDRFCKGLNRLGQIASERGFKLCFHHHMGTVVQTSEETDRMMSNTDPRYVFLCYDTGHFTFAGEDPLAMLKKYVDRVGHVHLKRYASARGGGSPQEQLVLPAVRPQWCFHRSRRRQRGLRSRVQGALRRRLSGLAAGGG